jgi:hypothetical protein
VSGGCEQGRDGDGEHQAHDFLPLMSRIIRETAALRQKRLVIPRGH